jgi:acetyl-CoA carboxylase biotin carboxyl carrier protein
MDLKYSDVQSILALIDAAEHLNEVDIDFNGLRLHVVRQGSGHAVASPAPPSVRAAGPAPQAPTSAATAPPTQPGQAAPSLAGHAVRAPMLGTFYRSPAPGEKPFVEVGQTVKADDTICLIEVMKLFNSVQAGVDGEVVGDAGRSD